jgi:hypothetical protein
MFIVTAYLVKPMNRDDIPQMRGMDGLKNGSPLGVEPKTEGIQGRTGFSVTGETNEQAPAAAPKTSEPAKASEPKSKTEGQTSGDSTTTTSSARQINPTIPVARTMPIDLVPEPFKP